MTLDTSPMGEEPERNANLLELLALCRENKVEWADTIPISSQAPFTYTSGEALSYTVENEDGSVSVYQTNFARLLEALPLKGLPEEPTAAEAMAALRAWFEVDQAVSDGEAGRWWACCANSICAAGISYAPGNISLPRMWGSTSSPRLRSISW